MVQDVVVTAILFILLLSGYSYLAYDATGETDKG